MVFVIQNSHNGDGLAVQIKLDEIIRVVHGVKHGMINLESLSQHELEQLQTKFAEMGSNARNNAKVEPSAPAQIGWLEPQIREAMTVAFAAV